jgi:hypothetical protein
MSKQRYSQAADTPNIYLQLCPRHVGGHVLTPFHVLPQWLIGLSVCVCRSARAWES